MAFTEFIELIKIYYNVRRIFWIFLSISGVLITLFTSNEIIDYIIKNETPNVTKFFILYFIIFFLLNLFVRYYDLNKFSPNYFHNILLSIFSFITELIILTVFGLLGFLVIEDYIPNLINGFKGLCLVSLSVLLGVTTVSSLTVEILKKRSDELKISIKENEILLDEYEKIRKQRLNEIERLDQILERLGEGKDNE